MYNHSLCERMETTIDQSQLERAHSDIKAVVNIVMVQHPEMFQTQMGTRQQTFQICIQSVVKKEFGKQK